MHYMLSPIENIGQYEGKKHAFILAPHTAERHEHNVTDAIRMFGKLGFERIGVSTNMGRDLSGRVDNTFIQHATPLREDLEGAIALLGEDIGSDDLFVLYVTGHGSLRKAARKEGEEAYVRLNYGFLTADETHEFVGQYIPASNWVIIADQCKGRDFVEPFQAPGEMIGISASRPGKSSYDETFPDHFLPRLKKTGDVTDAFSYAFIRDNSRRKGIQSPRMTVRTNGKEFEYPLPQRSHLQWAEKVQAKKLSRRVDQAIRS